ncbi:MAG TPA: V-type ATP synthase subunit A [Gaiellaceae bacterium]|nr:V-type ATP synthase subunit A [Gaiellaceae bacterium]
MSGTVLRVDGPVVEVSGLDTAAMLDLVEVGAARLPGEVIALVDGVATVQVYEYTGGLRPGEEVVSSGLPLTAELGPGLLGGVFDGMLRRLADADEFLAPGGRLATLAREPRFEFTPRIAAGADVGPGAVLGTVPEADALEHRVLVPPDAGGTVEWIADAGRYGVDDVIARVVGRELTLAHRWPVRRPRPFRSRGQVGTPAPLVTGIRALDLFFPLARGSSASVPGGFGTGKTVLLQEIAKWCDADVIVYVGCGERGNEMADVIAELRALDDPRTGRSLLARTVLVANTSNMPVLAREASIHTGVTVAEYFRDMGYHAVLIADSTSRWAEALREVASRTGQLPAEEGYPAALASELAAFYERAAAVTPLGGGEGSVTILAAVSPPGGDMSEPVSAHTRRFVRCTWSLDRDLAYARHYPAVSWRDSWSRDSEALADWHFLQRDADWAEHRRAALELLSEADRLESIAQLVGAASLPDRERVVLLGARLMREGVLQQSSLSASDAYCMPAKQGQLLASALEVYERCLALVARGVPAERLEQEDLSEVVRARDLTPPDGAAEVAAIGERVLARLEELA